MAVETYLATAAHYTREGLVPQMMQKAIQMSTAFARILGFNGKVLTKGEGRGMITRQTVPGMFGRDWKVLKTIVKGGSAGTSWETTDGPNTADFGSAVSLRQWDGAATYPTMRETTAPTTFQLTIPLASMKGNMYLPVYNEQLARNKHAFANLNKKYLEVAASDIASTMIHALLARTVSSKGGVIAAFTTPGSGTQTISSTGYTFTLTEGAPGLMRVGKGYDIFARGSNTRVNLNGPVFVDMVDALGTAAAPVTTGLGTVKVYVPAPESFNLANSTTYDIVPANSGRERVATAATYLPYSLEQFLIAGDTGETTIYGIDVTKHPEYKSMVRNWNNNVLTESDLIKMLGTLCRSGQIARRRWDALAEPGLFAKWFDQYESRMSFDRTNRVMTLKGGQGEVTVENLDYSLRFHEEQLMPAGRVYCVGLDSFETHTIPPVGNAGGMGFDRSIQLMGKANGYASDLTPTTVVGGANAGAMLELLQVPFRFYGQIVSEDWQGIRLNDVSAVYG